MLTDAANKPAKHDRISADLPSNVFPSMHLNSLVVMTLFNAIGKK